MSIKQSFIDLKLFTENNLIIATVLICYLLIVNFSFPFWLNQDVFFCKRCKFCCCVTYSNIVKYLTPQNAFLQDLRLQSLNTFPPTGNHGTCKEKWRFQKTVSPKNPTNGNIIFYISKSWKDNHCWRKIILKKITCLELMQ